MEKHQLSKSTFIRGVQCLKSLYLYKNRYFLRDRLSAEQLAKFKRGTDVGIFAQGLFPGGVDCKPKSPSQYRKSVEKTSEIIANNTADVIYEAAFQYDGVLILLDILVKNGNAWDAFEIKSSLKVSETFEMDAALQYYVLTNSGVNIERFFLVHLNPEYLRGEDLVINDLFKFVDLTEAVKLKLDYIAKQIAAEKEAIVLKSSPKIDIGTHCRSPYPCDFIGHCWKHVPAKSVFDLAAWNDEEKFDLYRKGILNIADIPALLADTHEKKLELKAYQSDQILLDKQQFDDMVGTIGKEFCYVSLLAHKQAIPAWAGYRPYSFVPVSFAIMDHTMSANKIFINQSSSTRPDDGFISFLAEHLTRYNRFLIYDGENFRNLLEQLSSRNQVHHILLEELSKKIVALKEIFTRSIYLNPATGNDFSLENIVNQVLKDSHFSTVSAESEVKAINVFLTHQIEKSTSQQQAFVEISLRFTAKIHHHLMEIS